MAARYLPFGRGRCSESLPQARERIIGMSRSMRAGVKSSRLVMRGRVSKHFAQLRLQCLRRNDCHAGAPGKQVPAHLLHSARQEFYGKASISLSRRALRRVKYPACRVRSCIRCKAKHNFQGQLLKHAEGLSCIRQEAEILPPLKTPVEKVG